MEGLDAARARIDRADREMAALFEDRMHAAAEIGAWKQARGLPIRDPARERVVVEKNLERLGDPALREDYVRFLQELMALSRDYQRRLREPEAGKAEAGDEAFLRRAIALSASAAARGNEPFGALLVKDGAVVMEAENEICSGADPTLHAELGLIRRFCRETGITDLRDYTLYSSCEPCFMCSGAIVWARVGRLVYAARNEDLAAVQGKAGCRCSDTVFAQSSHRPRVCAGLLREEAIDVLRRWFAGA